MVVSTKDWDIYSDDKKKLASVEAGLSTHLGRTHGGIKVDLGISSVRVSRKQLWIQAKEDVILCENKGVNPVHHYVWKAADANVLTPVRIQTAEKFEIRHNEAVEFNIAKNRADSVRFFFGKVGKSIDFSVHVEHPAPKINPKRRSSHLMSTTPKDEKKEDDEEGEEEDRVSIVDRLGDKFSYDFVMSDPEHCQTGSRIGPEFQADVPEKMFRYLNTEKRKLGVRRMQTSDDKKLWNEIKTEITAMNKDMGLRKPIDEEDDEDLMEQDEEEEKEYSDVYIKGLTMFFERSRLRQWPEPERKLFLELMYLFPKNFNDISKHLIRRYVHRKLKNGEEIKAEELPTTTKTSAFYYQRFKLGMQKYYAVVKKHFEERDQGNAGANMSLYLQLQAMNQNKAIEDAEKESGEQEKEEENLDVDNDDLYISNLKKKNFQFTMAGGKKKKGKRTYELQKLIEAGVISSGPDAVYLNYHGTRVTADLNGEGLIEFTGRVFESASAWSFFVKKNMNPKIRSDNGWSSVHYDGKPLSYYRDLYDPTMKNTLGGKSSSSAAAKSENVKTEETQTKRKAANPANALSALGSNLVEAEEDGSAFKKRKQDKEWSKYDRYCKCRKKNVETTLDDWYIQCSKGTSYCNGWVHPKCFDLAMTKKEGENVDNFTCPLCSLDTIEFAYVDPAHHVVKMDSALGKNRFQDLKTNTLFCSGLKLTPLEEKSVPPGSVLKKRKVRYIPGTEIRSKVTVKRVDENGHETETPVGWILGRILGIESDLGEEEHFDMFRYRVEYGVAPGQIELIDLENNPNHMLAKDWESSKCFQSQDAQWRLQAKVKI